MLFAFYLHYAAPFLQASRSRNRMLFDMQIYIVLPKRHPWGILLTHQLTHHLSQRWSISRKQPLAPDPSWTPHPIPQTITRPLSTSPSIDCRPLPHASQNIWVEPPVSIRCRYCCSFLPVYSYTVCPRELSAFVPELESDVGGSDDDFDLMFCDPIFLSRSSFVPWFLLFDEIEVAQGEAGQVRSDIAKDMTIGCSSVSRDSRQDHVWLWTHSGLG